MIVGEYDSWTTPAYYMINHVTHLAHENLRDFVGACGKSNNTGAPS